MKTILLIASACVASCFFTACSKELTREKAQKTLDKAIPGTFVAKNVLAELDRGRKIVNLEIKNYQTEASVFDNRRLYSGPGRAFFVQHPDGTWALTGFDFINGVGVSAQAGTATFNEEIIVE